MSQSDASHKALGSDASDSCDNDSRQLLHLTKVNTWTNMTP